MAQLITKMKEFLYGALEIPYISPELSSMRRPLVVHVSDTPSVSYGYIARMLRRLQPEILIHTGDIVDDVKLEFAPGQVGEYREKLRRFMALLRNNGVHEVYLVPGNHDNRAALDQECAGASIIRDNSVIVLRSCRFLLQHDYAAPQVEADYQLYGHTPEVKSDSTARPVRLNGLIRIYVISLPGGSIHALPYPGGTDSARKMLSLRTGM
jgi:predicted phosphodiesterase